MAVRTYYGIERVTVPGPDGTRLDGTVSGVAGGRVVVALDEASTLYPVQNGETGEFNAPGRIAQVLEQDLEFLVDGKAGTPSFSAEQLAYLKRTYGDKVAAVTEGEKASAPAAADQTFDVDPDDGVDEAALAAAALGGTTVPTEDVPGLPDGK